MGVKWIRFSLCICLGAYFCESGVLIENLLGKCISKGCLQLRPDVSVYVDTFGRSWNHWNHRNLEILFSCVGSDTRAVLGANKMFWELCSPYLSPCRRRICPSVITTCPKWPLTIGKLFALMDLSTPDKSVFNTARFLFDLGKRYQTKTKMTNNTRHRHEKKCIAKLNFVNFWKRIRDERRTSDCNQNKQILLFREVEGETFMLLKFSLR